MQGSPPDSVHSACSLGLEMLSSTFLSDDFPHICDRLKMAANPLIERRVCIHSLCLGPKATPKGWAPLSPRDTPSSVPPQGL